jgi:D-amino-acid oxidase
MVDVVVAGAGVVGLSTAIRLQQAGMRVAVVSSGGPEETVSWVAAAVWHPTHTRGDSRVLGWAGRTFDELAGQARRRVAGVTMRSTRMLLRGSTATPWWAGAVPDFRLVAGSGVYTGEWHFTVPAVEMGPYLNWQIEQFTLAGGVLLRRRLNRLAEAAELADPGGTPVVVNATGLAARELAGDPAVHPIRGRVVVVANPGWTTSVRDEDDPAGITYVHPRRTDIVLGGTFEPHQRDLTPDGAVSRAIVERCTALVPELAGAKVIRQMAGLRPGRDGGARVEIEPGAGAVRLVHNYGHGGAGVTLSWGCADEAAGLVAGL